MILQMIRTVNDSGEVEFAGPKGSAGPCSVSGMGPPSISRAVMEEAELYGQIQKALDVLGEALEQNQVDSAHCIPLESARPASDARTDSPHPESDEDEAGPRILPFPKRAL